MLKRNDDIIKEHSDSLIMYYGATDRWCPQKFYQDTKKAHKNLSIKLCDQEFKHAFLLDHGEEVANMVAEWFHKNFEVDF